jgi:hypothetical protein
MKKIYFLFILSCICLAAVTVNAQTTVTEGFEHAGTFPPPGWTVGGTTTTGIVAATASFRCYPCASPHSGTYYADWESYSISSGNEYLITPVVDWSARGGVATNLTIWFYRDGGSYQGDATEGVTAYVNTAASLTGATSLGFVPRASNVAISGGVTGTSTPGTGTSGWYQYTFTIPTTFNSATNYIIFNFTTQWGDDCYMDDIQYTTYPCSTPAITGTTSVCAGSTTALTDASGAGTWVSGTTSVATVSSTGVVTGVSGGTSTITYTPSAGCSKTAVVTVSPSPAVTVSATPSTICMGSSSSLSSSGTNPGAPAYTVTSIAYSYVTQTSPTTIPSWSPSTDDGAASISIPFTFNYFGTNYTTMSVGTNGYVQLGGSSTGYSVVTFPSASYPGAIAPFLCDLDVLSPGSVTYSTEGTSPNRKFVISFNQVSPCCSYSDSYDGEVILYETTNTIDILVSKAASNSHTCGIQNPAGTVAFTPPGRNNASYAITTAEAWRFSIPTVTYAWNANPTLSSTTIANPTATPSVTTTYTVTATATNGCATPAPITVTVNPGVIGVPASLFCTGTTVTLTDAVAGGAWTSSNTTVATIVSGTGVLSAVSAGTTTISYTVAGCSATATVTVNQAPAATSGASAVCSGLTTTLTNAISGGNWTSSNTAAATVVAGTGVVSGVAAGSTTISYTMPGGCFATAAVTVNASPAAIAAATFSVCATSTIGLTDGTAGGVWSSLTTTVATISGTGTVGGVAAGTSVISYTLPTGCAASNTVTVIPLANAGTISGAGAVPVGANITLTSSGLSGGTWTSSNTAMATVNSATGVVGGVANGTAIISYTFTNACGTATATKSLITGGVTWYSVTTGGDMSVLTNWWSVSTNSGAQPATFANSGDTWVFQSNMTSSATTLSLAGAVQIVSGGILNAPSTLLNVGGNWSNTGGSFNHNNGTVTFNGSVAANISGALTGANKFNNLTFNGTGSWNFGANSVDVAGNLTISSGTLTAPSTTMQVGGNWSNSGTFNHNNGTVAMTSTTTGKTLSGTMTGTSKFNNLTFNGIGGGWTFSSNVDINGSFNINNGTVTAPAILQIAGSWNNSGTFNNNGGTVATIGTTAGNTFSGAMTGTNKFNNLTINGAGGAWSFGSNSADVGGNFTILAGTVTAPSTTLQVAGNWSNTGGSFSNNLGTVVMNGNGALSLSSVAGGMTGTNKFFNLTFNGTSGSSWTFGANSSDVGGNFIIASGMTVIAPSGAATTGLQIGGSYTDNGTFNANGGTLTFNGTSSGLTLTGNMTGTSKFNILNFNGVGGAWTIVNNADVASNITMSNGSVSTPASHVLNVSGNFQNAIGGAFIAGNSSTINVGSSLAGSWLNSGGIFTANTSTVNMIATTTGQTLSGNMTGSNKFNILNFNGVGGAWSFGANSADVGGNFTVTNGSVTTPTTTLNIFGNLVNSATLTAGAGGIINLGSSTAGTGNWTNNSVFNASTGTVNMVGTVSGITLNGIMSAAAGTGKFNNLTFNGVGGSFSFTANADVTNNTNANFTITAGTVTTPAGHVLNIAGNWSNTGTFNAGTGSSINVGGNAGANAWSNSGTFNASTSTVTFNATTAGTRTLTGAMTGTNKFYALTFAGSPSTAIYTFGASPADVANNFTISGANTVVAPSGTLQIAGNYANSGGTFTHNSGTVNMNGTVSGLTLSGSMTTATNRFNNLTFNGSGGNWTFLNNADVFGNFTITTGAVTPASSGSLTVFGSWYNNGSFTHNSSTVTMSGTTAGITLGGNMTGANSFYNLTFNGAGTKTFIAPNATVVGDYVETAGTVVAPSGTLNVGGNWTHTGGTFTHNNGTVLMSGTTAGPYTLTSLMTGTNSFYNLTFNSAIPIAAWSFSANVQTANNLIISNGTVTAPSSGTITIGGNYTNNGTFTHNNSTVLMNGTNTGLSLNGNLSASAFLSSFYNLTFNGVGGSWTFGANAADVNGNFTITNGTVTAPSTTLQVVGNWVNNGTYNHNGGTVNLNGTVLQSVTGATTFNNLTLNNTVGFNFNNDETINGQLGMTAGNVSIGNNNLILGPAAPAIAGTFSSTLMIVGTGGQVRKQMTGNGSYLFPIGDNSANYTPITINFTGGSYNPGAYYGIKVIAAKQPNNANVNNYLRRYWNLVTSNITSPVYAVTSATYIPGDVTGTESLMSGGQYPGSLPWLKFAPVNTATHTFATTAVTSNTSDFTAITTQAPSITSVPSSVTICNGTSTTLSTTAASGDPGLSYTWAPANSLNASFGTAVIASPTVTTVYTVTITDGNGFTGFSTTTVNVNPIPTPITGVTTICTGFTSALSSTPSGGTWTSSNSFQAIVDPSSGLVTAMSPGNPTITYAMSTGCIATAALTINPSPAGISGTPAVCAGATTTLADATGGGVWSNTSPAIASVDPLTGVVSGFVAGTANVTYTLPSDGCYAKTTVTVNPLPTVYNVSTPGSSSYCAGSPGVDIQLSGSDNSVNYQLYNGTAVVGTMPGTGSALDFGMQPAGTYTVNAVNASSGCAMSMTGSVNATVNPLPNQHNVTGGGGYCTGTGGADIGLDGSDPGTLYTVYESGIPVSGALMVGTGSALDFGFFPAGVYTIVAQDASTGCSLTMNGSATVILNLPPAAFAVTGGGNYCSGGAGVRIGLGVSNTGVDYELFNSGGSTGIIVAGSGAAIDFGLQTTPDVYTIVATNTSTGCTNNMTGSATVGINPLPAAYTISATGTGGYCAGGTGVDVTLNSSDFGINYQLYNGAAVGSPVSGTGTTLHFGAQTAGTYTAIGTDATTGCTSNMTGSATVSAIAPPTVYNLSTPGGVSSYCATDSGLHMILSGSDAGTNYDLFNGGTLLSSMTGTGGTVDFGLQTLAGAYSVVATNPATTCTNNMNSSVFITINTPPTAYTVTGGGNYCAGGTGIHVGLTYSNPGVNYQLARAGVAVGTAIPGMNSSLDFGLQTTAGVYTVIASNAVNGCSNLMTGTANIIMNTLPAAFTLTSSSSSYCAGTTGVSMMLSGSEVGVDYQLYNGSASSGSPMAGTGASLTFSSVTGAGIYTIVGRNATTGCTKTMNSSAPITVNALPTAYNVTGGGNYCSGSGGVPVGLSNSTPGIMYQLYNTAGAVGSPVAGTGAALSFGNQTASGAYTVVAANTATTCTNNMSGSATVNANSLPTVFTVTGGGSYCAGTSGSSVGLSSSELGVNYQLYVGGLTAGAAVPGTGHALDFGMQATAGTYTVRAVNAATSCTNNMAGGTVINISPAPNPFTAFGGGSFCVGSTGVHVRLSGSDAGVNYQLYNGGAASGSPVSGTAGPLDFGVITTSGNYTVVAQDPATSCTSVMIHTVTVTANPLPVAYTVTGGGNYCAGAAGVHVGTAMSNIGIDYLLYNGGAMIGSPVHGGGMVLDFGLQTAPGVYTVVARDAATGCTSNMTGSTTIGTIAPVTPAVTMSASATSVCAGVYSTFTATPVNGGSAPAYQWQVNGANAGVGPTFTYAPANGDLVSVILTSSEACALPATVNTSTSMTVNPVQMPMATISANPGNSVCPGTAVTFTASVAYGGDATTYTWLKNTTVVGTGAIYTYTPVTNGDAIILLMGSNYPCRFRDTAFSNDIIMTIDPAAPAVSILANPGTSVAAHQLVTLTADVTDGGSAPSYQWYLNGTLLTGETNATLVSDQFANGDSISCRVLANGVCGNRTIFNSIILNVSTTGVKNVSGDVSIKVLPNPNKGTFTIKGSLGTKADEEVTVELTDMLGQVVYKGKVMSRNGSIDDKVQISGAASGMYMLTLRSGDVSSVFHVVIEE